MTTIHHAQKLYRCMRSGDSQHHMLDQCIESPVRIGPDTQPQYNTQVIVVFCYYERSQLQSQRRADDRERAQFATPAYRFPYMTTYSMLVRDITLIIVTPIHLLYFPVPMVIFQSKFKRLTAIIQPYCGAADRAVGTPSARRAGGATSPTGVGGESVALEHSLARCTSLLHALAGLLRSHHFYRHNVLNGCLRPMYR